MAYQMLMIRYSGDNDFARTLEFFAKVICNTERLRPFDECVDSESSRIYRETIANYFNAMANDLHSMLTGRTIDFLQIDPSEIFWGNDEVNEKLKTYDQWGNGDSVIIYPDKTIQIV